MSDPKGNPPVHVAALLDRDPMWHRLPTGEIDKREAACGCGATYTQRRLSVRWMTMAERGRGAQQVMDQIPGLYVPVLCPKCERRSIGAPPIAWNDYRSRQGAA